MAQGWRLAQQLKKKCYGGSFVRIAQQGKQLAAQIIG